MKKQTGRAMPGLLLAALACLLLGFAGASAGQEAPSTLPAAQPAEDVPTIEAPAAQPAEEAPPSDAPATQPAAPSATDEDPKAAPPASEPQEKPSPTKPARPPRRVLFNTYLYSLDHSVAAYGRARNSVERTEAAAKARQVAGEGLEDVLLIIHREVVDVRAPKDGVAEILVGGFPNNHYFTRKDAPVTAISVLPIKVRMTAEQARQVRKGDILAIAAEPRWTPAGSQTADWATSSQHIAVLMIRGTPVSLGTITARKYTCTIRGMTLQSPYVPEPSPAR